MSTNRIIVESALYDRFVDAFVERARGLKVGDPNEPDTVIGPLINAKQMKTALDRLQAARVSGARQVLNGAPVGRVLPPQVFADVARLGTRAERTLQPDRAADPRRR
jgi:aldehyde dehydrogenase (NAD+)